MAGMTVTAANVRQVLEALRQAGEEVNWAGANLMGADLSDANLSEAYLRRANLNGADLSDANLSGADLSGADLNHANLRGANLSNADLTEADLNGADLSGADLSGADLTQSNLEGVQLDWEQIPYVPNIDTAILQALQAGGELAMEAWHTCATTHCRGGWAVHLAGEQGDALQARLGTNAAASLIYARSGSHPVPDWYATTEEALADIQQRAERQLSTEPALEMG